MSNMNFEFNGEGMHAAANAPRKMTSCVLAASLAVGGIIGAPCVGVSEAFADEVGVVSDAALEVLSADVNQSNFAATIATAKAGDVLKLSEDVTVSVNTSLEISNALTLDLNGHTLTLDACNSKAQGSFEKGAITYTGTGALRVTDSAKGNTGTLDIKVGRPVENKASTTAPYIGIAVMAGTFTADNCKINVTYAGDSFIKPEFKLYGIGVGEASTTLGSNATLVVNSAKEQGKYGAIIASGIYAIDDAEACSITTESSSSIEVNNISEVQTLGSTPQPDGVVQSMGTSTSANLVELEFDESSPLYAQVQESFKANASFDSVSDKNGYIFGSQMYYMNAMRIACGLTVWAYSDPVSTEDAGTLDAIVATHVFVRATYQTPLEAYGISAVNTFTGNVLAKGSINVNTTYGHAVGVLESDGGTWEVQASDAISANKSTSGAKITGSCASDTYRTRIGKLDLANYVECDEGASLIFTKSGSLGYEIRTVAPQVLAQAKASELEDARAADAAYADLYGNTVPATSYTTDDENEASSSKNTILQYYRKGLSGNYIYTSESLKGVDWTQDLMSVANERVKIGDTITIDGTVYTFLGWSPRISDKQAVFTDTMQIINSGSSIAGATAVFYGIYSSEQQTFSVKFMVDGQEYSSVSDCAGTSSVYSAFNQSSQNATPTCDREGVTFKGWATSASSTQTLYANIKTLNSLAAFANSNKEITLYGVWSDSVSQAGQTGADASYYTVNFYAADGTTLLDSVSVPAGLTVFDTLGELVQAPNAAADLFEGWYDAYGNSFSQTDTAVLASTTVYAKYKQTGESTGTLAGAGVVSGAVSGAGSAGGSSSLSTSSGSTGLTAAGSGGTLAGAGSATGALARTDAAAADADGSAEDAAAGEAGTSPEDGEGADGAEDAAIEAKSASDTKYSEGVAYADTLDGEVADSRTSAIAGLSTFVIACLALMANGVRLMLGRRRRLSQLEAEAAAAESAPATDRSESVRF